jgi:ATP-binding cassette subfamily B multidrug efflux pump
VTRVTNDIEALNEIFTSGLVTVFGDLLLIVAILILMFVRSWRLTLVALAIGPLIAGATLWFRLRAREFYRAMRIRLARINAFLQENITGMSVIQMFRREDRNRAAFAGINDEFREVSIRNVFYYALFFPSVDVLSSFATASVVYFGGRLIIFSVGAFDFGDFYLFWFLFGRLFEPIHHLAEKYNILQAAMAASERVFGILDTEPEIAAPAEARAAEHIEGGIEFRDVSFKYDSEPVLRGVSFRIDPGDRVALVGATGGGKTTIANLIVRFYDVEEGSVMIDGADIREYEPRGLRNHFGLVLQDVFLFTGSVLENIRLDTHEIPRERVEDAARHVSAHRFIERLPEGLDSPVAERGATFSAGERQLLSFARALAFDPRILILDEATSAVDPETERVIQEALVTLMRGRTSIVIAHRLSTIKAMDRILVVHKGKVREEGTHDELLARQGIYHKLYQLQYADQE